MAAIDHPDRAEGPDRGALMRWLSRLTRPVIGWVLMGLGALLMLFGWLGVSREALVAKQLPYFLSGGIGGVLLAVIGAYFLGTEELRKDSGRLDRLEEMVEQLHQALLTRADAPAPTVQVVERTTSSNGNGGYVVVPRGRTYHRADCSMVAGKDGARTLTPGEVRERDLSACSLCEPVLTEA